MKKREKKKEGGRRGGEEEGREGLEPTQLPKNLLLKTSSWHIHMTTWWLGRGSVWT